MTKKIFSLLGCIFCALSSHAQTYNIDTVVSNLSFPVAFAIAPDGRYFITLKGGFSDPAVNAKVVTYDASGNFLATFWDFTDSTTADFERGVLGICLDPNFSVNRYVYVYYNHLLTDQRIRVVRFTESGNVGTNPVIILDILVGAIAGNHVGGNMRFRPSETDKIYISIGDIAVSTNSQQLNNPFGKILRLNSDGTIPSDNPFYDDGNPATGNDDRIWAYGLRNSFDLTFSSFNDSLYASENGPSDYDEVNYIVKGKNYGWPVCSGFCSPPNPLYKDPMDVWGPPVAVTGIIFYNHTLMPEFDKHLLVANNNIGQITDFTLGNSPAYDTIIARQTAFTLDELTTLMQGAEGCIYAMNGGYVPSGKIYRICPQGFGIEEARQGNFFSLEQNFPNPFFNETEIKFSLTQKAKVNLSLFDLLGRKVVTLADEEKTSGIYLIKLNADAHHLPSGVYYYKMEIRDGNSVMFSSARKMIVIR